MGRRKKEIKQLAPTGFSEICDEIKEENKIIDSNPPQQAKNIKKKEYILQKIILEGKIYYRDPDFNLMDDKLNFAGMYTRKGSVYEYIIMNHS